MKEYQILVDCVGVTNWNRKIVWLYIFIFILVYWLINFKVIIEINFRVGYVCYWFKPKDCMVVDYFFGFSVLVN
jgi:hypothetical protein